MMIRDRMWRITHLFYIHDWWHSTNLEKHWTCRAMWTQKSPFLDFLFAMFVVLIDVSPFEGCVGPLYLGWHSNKGATGVSCCHAHLVECLSFVHPGWVRDVDGKTALWQLFIASQSPGVFSGPPLTYDVDKLLMLMLMIHVACTCLVLGSVAAAAVSLLGTFVSVIVFVPLFQNVR